MALVIENQKRKITVQRGTKNVEVDDIPGFTMEDIRKFYAGVYPELATAILDGPKMEQDHVAYHFKTKLGDKG